MKSRIVERTYNDGSIKYIIQQRHFLFRIWVDAWINSPAGASFNDSFSTLDAAKKALCYFDGTKNSDKVIVL